MERCRGRIFNLRVVMMVVAEGDPALFLAFIAMINVLASECQERLCALDEWWSVEALVASVGRSAESSTDDELRRSFCFERDAIGEFIGLLGVPHDLRPVRGRRFGGEEAFLLLLRRLGRRERSFHLAQVFGRSLSPISKMYDVVLDHVFKHAMPTMRWEIWEDHLPSFAIVLPARGCPNGHCFGFIDGTLFTICRPTYGQEAMYSGGKRRHKVKHHCVVLPNFLIGDWFGLAVGRVHDSLVVADSNMVQR